MRKKVGLIITMLGIISLLKPNLDFKEVIYDIQFQWERYWPYILILIGIYLQKFQLYHARPKKGRKSSHKRFKKA